MKISVIISVYNEINTMGEILSRVLEVDLPKEVIVVDDCSMDGTREFLKEWEVGRKKIKWMHGLKAIFSILRYNFLIRRPRISFTKPSRR